MIVNKDSTKPVLKITVTGNEKTLEKPTVFLTYDN